MEGQSRTEQQSFQEFEPNKVKDRTETMQLWRTPTTMDSKEDSLKHATKLLQGKNLRATGARIQITSRRSDGRGDQIQPRTDGTSTRTTR